MTTAKSTISPLRQRMLDDMRMRKFGDKTQTEYVCVVRNFIRKPNSQRERFSERIRRQ